MTEATLLPSDDPQRLLSALLSSPLETLHDRLLLKTLLETPLDLAEHHQRLVYAHAESRFDQFLLRGAQVSAIACLVCSGVWFFNGFVYDKIFAPRSEGQSASVIIGSMLSSDLSEMLERASAQAALPPVQLAPGLLSLPQQISYYEQQGATLAPLRILIPSIQVNSPVIKAAYKDGTWAEVDYAVGYFEGTGLPGERSNMVMGGHAGLRGGVFLNLPALRAGDDIFVETKDWRFHYRVRGSSIVWPNDMSVLDAQSGATLTLITCTNWDLQRLVVVADLLDGLPIQH